MSTNDFTAKMDVIYTPTMERGMVSSVNDAYVFVKFYSLLAIHGWQGTTSQGCRPEDLEPA